MSKFHNTPWRLVLLVCCGILLLVGGIFSRQQTGTPDTAVSPRPSVKSPEPPPAPPLPGDQLLDDYGATNLTVRHDLRQLHRVLDSAFILVKQADTRNYATNEDLAEFLRGRNRNRTAFVSDDSPIFGRDGRLLDRWGSPLIVHPVGRGKLELRSAGADGIAWNADDVTVDSPR